MILRIYSDIVTGEEKAFYEWMGLDAVCFQDIDTFIASIPAEDGEINMLIDCRGGNVSEGWAIYDALRTSGKRITAEVVGKVASMGTIILMAAPKESRKARQNARLCIHRPYVTELCGEIHADDLRRVAEDLEKDEAKFLDLYTERTGAAREELHALMLEDKYIDMTEAQRLGFIGEIINPNTAKKMARKNFKERLLAFINANSDEAVALELQTEEGGTLVVEREDGEPEVGDKASPDGTHKMPDGKTIVVTDGVITEISDTEKAAADNGEGDGNGEGEHGDGEKVAELEKQVEDLEKRVAELEKEVEDEKAKTEEARKQAKTTEERAILNAVAINGGRKWLESLQSTADVPSRSMSDKMAGKDDLRAKLEARRSARHGGK